MRSVNRRRLVRRKIERRTSKPTWAYPTGSDALSSGWAALPRPLGAARSAPAPVRPAARVVLAPAPPHPLAAAHAWSTVHVGALVIAGILRPARAVPAISPLAGVVAMLRAKLRLSGHDDAVIVLGMLEIALRRDHVARRECVARKRHVLLGDVRRGSSDFDVRTVGLVVPCQWILGLAATAAAPAFLLSLPHRLLLQP